MTREQYGVWRKPELAVYARGAPEEAVLTGCKLIGVPGYLTPENTTNSCVTMYVCVTCNDPYAS